jgi:hypothetical protein
MSLNDGSQKQKPEGGQTHIWPYADYLPMGLLAVGRVPSHFAMSKVNEERNKGQEPAASFISTLQMP